MGVTGSNKMEIGDLSMLVHESTGAVTVTFCNRSTEPRRPERGQQYCPRMGGHGHQMCSCDQCVGAHFASSRPWCVKPVADETVCVWPLCCRLCAAFFLL